MTSFIEHRQTVTIITPVFNEAQNLERYAEEVAETLLSRTDYDINVLFVDDGSHDESWSLIQKLSAVDERFRGIRLSRNFGSHTALSAGFLQAGDTADAVATLACDLQDPPATLNEFIDSWRAGAKIVWGVRRTRKDSRWRVLTSRAFHHMLRRYALPRESMFATGSFLLLDRRVLECFRQFTEHNRITFALVAWTGFEQDRVHYDRQARTAGTSGWNVGGMVKAMYDAFVGFSTLPVRMITWAGFAAFLVAVLLMLYVLGVALLGANVPGWSSQMLIVSGFFAVQFSLMAIVGEYLYRIYAEVVRRPLYFVSESTGERA